MSTETTKTINDIVSEVAPEKGYTCTVKHEADPEGTPNYGGAHIYKINKCEGFSAEKNQSLYVEEQATLQFVFKTNESVVAGLQDEQVLHALIDRNKKLDAVFPDPTNKAKILALEAALACCEARVIARIERGVMGQLKK